jgi:hypothetical protein
LLAVLALFTEHTVTYWNENLFFVNPLSLALLPLGIGYARGAAWAARWHPRIWGALAALALLGLVGKLLPNFDQENTLVWTLLAPPILAGAWSAWAFSNGIARDSSPADRSCTPSTSA